jgi:sugar-specific transcriptional regulator TrmB
MKKRELRDSLSRLRSELKNAKEVDKASGEILKKLDHDIQRILENSGDVPRSHHVSLLGSLNESVEFFEASHPELTSVMQRIIKALSDMGI